MFFLFIVFVSPSWKIQAQWLIKSFLQFASQKKKYDHVPLLLSHATQRLTAAQLRYEIVKSLHNNNLNNEKIRKGN